MSKAERTRLKVGDMKEEIAREQCGRCATCGLPLGPVVELAHRVPQRKWLIKMWGEAVIHHRKNMVATHPGICNSGAQFCPESIEAQKHLNAIRKEIEHVEE
jgi:hypothetical protein